MPTFLNTDWVRALAAVDMMAVEHVLSDVYTARCKGLSDFALFDGGAHKGFHTTRMGALDGCSAIYAVEADPFMLEELDQALSRATIHGTRKPLFGPDGVDIHVVAKALQNRPDIQTISWKSSTSHVGRSCIVNDASDVGTIWDGRKDMEYRDEMSVPATTIDKVLAHERRPVPFLKLDLEGADILSLFGAENTLTRKRPVVAYENSVHAPEVHGFTIEDFAAYLETLGYVPLDFAGQRITPKRWFAFFEAWLAPADQADWLSETLQTALFRQKQNIPVELKTEVTTPRGPESAKASSDGAGVFTMPDVDIPAMAIMSDGRDDTSELSMTVARRLWTDPARHDQPLDRELCETDWDRHGAEFTDRIIAVLRKLESEDILLRRRVEIEDASPHKRQWMLDSGRVAWLIWLYGRRSDHVRDESTEKELWAEQSTAYRSYVRSALRGLEADGIHLARRTP